MQEVGVLLSHLISGIITNNKTFFAGTGTCHRSFLGMGAAEVESGLEGGCWGDSLQLYHSSSPQPDIAKASQLWFSSSCGCVGVWPSPFVSLLLPTIPPCSESALAPGAELSSEHPRLLQVGFLPFVVLPASWNSSAFGSLVTLVLLGSSDAQSGVTEGFGRWLRALAWS